MFDIDQQPEKYISIPKEHGYIYDILGQTLNAQWKINSVLPKAIDMLNTSDNDKAEAIIINLLTDPTYDVQKAVLKSIKPISELSPSLSEEILRVRLHMLSTALKKLPCAFLYNTGSQTSITTNDIPPFAENFDENFGSDWRHKAFAAYDYRHEIFSYGYGASAIGSFFPDPIYSQKANRIYAHLSSNILALRDKYGVLFDHSLASLTQEEEDQFYTELPEDKSAGIEQARQEFIEYYMPSSQKLIRDFAITTMKEADEGAIYKTEKQRVRHDRLERSLFKPSVK